MPSSAERRERFGTGRRFKRANLFRPASRPFAIQGGFVNGRPVALPPDVRRSACRQQSQGACELQQRRSVRRGLVRGFARSSRVEERRSRTIPTLGVRSPFHTIHLDALLEFPLPLPDLLIGGWKRCGCLLQRLDG